MNQVINRSKHLEALIRKHWRELIKGSGGVWLDAYNNSVSPKVSGTILTRIDAGNMWFITERTDEKANSDKPRERRQLHDEG